jgi:hypothetical protein
MISSTDARYLIQLTTYTFNDFVEDVRTKWIPEEKSILAILKENPRFIGRSRENGTMVIHAASEGEYFEIVEYLLKNRVCANSQDHCLWTPLMFAASKGNIPIMELLLSNGANIDARNIVNQTAALIAAKYQQQAAHDYLISSPHNDGKLYQERCEKIRQKIRFLLSK